MRTRTLIAGMLVVVCAAVALAITSGHDDSYRVTMRLDNADGLESGSSVVIGGLTVGKVKLELSGQTVLAHLDIDRKYAPIGRNAKATIASQNLLGQKQVRIDPGSRSDPAPDGAVLPAASVASGTDLDQVLDVLGPDTRARLAILMSEAGTAVAGRKVAVDTFVGRFPEILQRGAALADQLASDNHVLGDLVSKTDRYVATVAADRTSLTRAVDHVGQTAVTVAGRRSRLRQTLRNAPAALSNLRRFLTDLRQSAAPLGRTARNLQAIAPPLKDTLRTLPSFQRAASPTLDAAVAAAPALSRLGDKATPVVQRALPTLNSAAALTTTELPPTAAVVDHSFSNLLAILENWSRAIQFRDRLSHVFRAELAIPVVSLTSAVERVLNANRKPEKQASKNRRRPTGRKPALPTIPQSSAPRPKLPQAVQQTVREVTDAVGKILGGVGATVDKAAGSTQRPKDTGASSPLLDFLLGS